MLVARELRRLARILELDERLATLAQGRMDEATGLVAVTDRRIVFIGKQLVVEERTLQAQRAMVSFDELRKVEGSQRTLSGTLELHLRRGRIQFTDLNPPERAIEMAEISKRYIAELRKARKPGESHALAPAGVEETGEASGTAAALAPTGHVRSGREIAETA